VTVAFLPFLCSGHITLSCIPFWRSHNQRHNVSCRVVSCRVVSCHVMLLLTFTWVYSHCTYSIISNHSILLRWK